jgi:hypothetical protein
VIAPLGIAIASIGIVIAPLGIAIASIGIVIAPISRLPACYTQPNATGARSTLHHRPFRVGDEMATQRLTMIEHPRRPEKERQGA